MNLKIITHDGKVFFLTIQRYCSIKKFIIQCITIDVQRNMIISIDVKRGLDKIHYQLTRKHSRKQNRYCLKMILILIYTYIHTYVYIWDHAYMYMCIFSYTHIRSINQGLIKWLHVVTYGSRQDRKGHESSLSMNF